jgi:hypothetical protein
VLGGFVAGDGFQRRAAVLVTTLAGGYGMLLPLANTLPATVPIALIFILLHWGGLPRRWRANATAPTASAQRATA